MRIMHSKNVGCHQKCLSDTEGIMCINDFNKKYFMRCTKGSISKWKHAN